MNVKAFTPNSIKELFASLNNMTTESKIISGGTDLIIRLNSGICKPDALLYLGGIKSFSCIEKKDNSIEIGAMATMTNISDNEYINKYLTAIAHAAKDVGSLQIRNKGTIGGNVANASAAGDLHPTLFMFNAEVEIAMPNGCLKKEPIEKVILGPGRTSLNYNEAIVKFIVPIPESSLYRSAFLKLGFRKALTISRIGLSIGLDIDNNGIIKCANVVAGAISVFPVHVKVAEQYLVGKTINDETKHEVGKALSDLIMELTPEMFDRDYKIGAAFGIVEDAFNLLQK